MNDSRDECLMPEGNHARTEMDLAAAMPRLSSSSPTGNQVEAYRDVLQPLGTANSGRLVFASSAGGIRIRANPRLRHLYRARFEGQIPSVRVENGMITIRYHVFSVADWLDTTHQPRAAVVLNGSIPWEIEFRGGLFRLAANLAGLKLRSLDLNCSASKVRITLPRPAGTVYLYVAGSPSNVVLRRPAGVAMRVQISGGGSEVTFDGLPPSAGGGLPPGGVGGAQGLPPSGGGGIGWQTARYANEADRYDLSISSRVSKLRVMTW
jgi:hypothetical protein